MACPPEYLLIENVVGFEKSETRATLVATLGTLAYHVQEFILSPKQFGVPYSRPRYFCLARRRPFLVATAGRCDPWLVTPRALLRTLAQGMGDVDEVCCGDVIVPSLVGFQVPGCDLLGHQPWLCSATRPGVLQSLRV
jgi:hypothetical protein